MTQVLRVQVPPPAPKIKDAQSKLWASFIFGAGEEANCFASMRDLKAGDMSHGAIASTTVEAGSRKFYGIKLSVTKAF